MKPLLLAVTAIGEAVTGVILLAYPPVVVRLLFGAEIADAGIVMSRIAGIALIALGVACWPGGRRARALCGMLTYSALAGVYLASVGLGGEFAGKLLWPAVGFHAVLATLLGRAWLVSLKTGSKVSPVLTIPTN
jgi:hypothetical protein